MGVARVTPAGVAPEPLEESWTPLMAALLFLMQLLLIFLFTEGRLFRKGAPDPRWPALPF